MTVKLIATLASVNERLATEHGIVLQQPAFSRYYLQLGEISSYPPGFKENASIFCHTNPWMMIGEAIAGHGDQAFDYYKRICPAAREGISEIHRCEPYVYAQTIAGRDNPRHGEAKNSWLTGTAAWNYVAITQWILGIRPAYDGLQIAPVIPMDWQGFTATRIFRGVTYHITVERQGGGNTVSLVVDGKPVEGNIAPLPPRHDGCGGQGHVAVRGVGICLPPFGGITGGSSSAITSDDRIQKETTCRSSYTVACPRIAPCGDACGAQTMECAPRQTTVRLEIPPPASIAALYR